MYIIQSGRTKINIEGIWSSVGVDLHELLIDADTAARHEFCIVNNKSMPYTTQTSVMAGEIGWVCWDKVKAPSLLQIDVIVFSDIESELRYLVLKKNNNLFIRRGDLQNN